MKTAISSRARRPASVTSLALFVLFLTAWQGLRLGRAILFWDMLVEYEALVSPLYIAASAGFWLIAGAPLAWGLWRGKTWAWYAACGTTAGYGAWYWFDRLFVQAPRPGWAFALGLTLMLAAISILWLLSPDTKHYFRGIQSDPAAIQTANEP
ncbi:MAG: hypothetical protein JXB85_13690 [Anaerolineales bacterium]|nr:hypothetical protein [Anaerolineales bacterium]